MQAGSGNDGIAVHAVQHSGAHTGVQHTGVQHTGTGVQHSSAQHSGALPPPPHPATGSNAPRSSPPPPKTDQEMSDEIAKLQGEYEARQASRRSEMAGVRVLETRSTQEAANAAAAAQEGKTQHGHDAAGDDTMGSRDDADHDGVGFMGGGEDQPGDEPSGEEQSGQRAGDKRKRESEKRRDMQRIRDSDCEFATVIAMCAHDDAALTRALVHSSSSTRGHPRSLRAEKNYVGTFNSVLGCNNTRDLQRIINEMVMTQPWMANTVASVRGSGHIDRSETFFYAVTKLFHMLSPNTAASGSVSGQ